MNLLSRHITATIGTAVCMCAATIPAQTAQSYQDAEDGRLSMQKLVGPRMGMSFVVPTNDKVEKRLDENGVDNLISQFGWQFEWLLEPKYTGPAFVIELIPLIGGVEYGTCIPSLSFVMGIRMPKGFEFGMGPMAAFTGDLENPVGSSLVMAVGKSLNFNGVNIPLNLALTTRPDDHRVSFIVGYALSNRKR